MNDKLVELLNKLSDKLGVTVSHLWAVLLKQSYIEGLSVLFWATVLTIGSLVIGFFLCKDIREVNKEEYFDEKFPQCLCLCLLVLIWLMWCPLMIDQAVTELVNPEYWALGQITGMLK